MAEKTRICVLMPGHWSAVMGGAQYQAKCIVDALVASGRFEVGYLARNFDPGYRPRGYRLLRAGNPLGLRHGHLYLDAPSLWWQLRRLRPQVIYQRVGCAYTGIGAAYARASGARMVWQVAHDSEVTPVRSLSLHRHLDKRLLEYGIRHSDAIVTQTHDQERLLAEHYGREDSALIRNFHPPAGESSAKDGPLRVVWVANLKPFKRPHLFVRLARELARPGVTEFVMLGELQGDRQWRRSICRCIEQVPGLRYLGGCSQEQVNRVLAGAHLLVNTSEAEGFSNTFIQAWMRRVPVVSLQVDPDGLLGDGRLGYACAGDFARMRDRVAMLLADHGRRNRIGEAAYRHAMAQHGPDNAAQFMELFEELARSGRAPRPLTARTVER